MSLSGDRIRACRIKNHLTQEEVARHLGIGKQAVYKYESGAVTNIPLENIQALAALFSVTPAYLAGWDESDLNIDSHEHELVESYRSLTPRGQTLLLERSEELKVLYGKKSESDSAESV